MPSTVSDILRVGRLRDLILGTRSIEVASAERRLGSIGAISGVVGAALALAANAAYPRPTQWDRPEPLLELIARSDRGSWLGIHLGMLFGALLIFGALVALARTVTAPRASAFAQLGVGAAGVSAALWTVISAADGAAMKTLADAWAAAPPAQKVEALRIAQAVAVLIGALFSAGIVVGFGVTFSLFGLAVALDEGGPRWFGWIGWIGFLAAVAALVIGLLQWYRGASVLLTNQLFPLVAFVLLAWMLVASIVLWLSVAE